MDEINAWVVLRIKKRPKKGRGVMRGYYGSTSKWILCVCVCVYIYIYIYIYIRAHAYVPIQINFFSRVFCRAPVTVHVNTGISLNLYDILPVRMTDKAISKYRNTVCLCDSNPLSWYSY